ncbi:MAG: accessory Sec system protein Asp3 [Clostridiales bacterium]|nr:accessory Sec system protein Asp3 [Clostridiales bacterium]
MADSVLYLIRWDSFSANPYLYGSSVQYLSNGNVRFMNEMMPSGYPINEWTSYTNFQRDRHEPQLPLLKECCTYSFHAYFSENPSDTVFLRFDFYDQQGNRLKYYIFDEKRGSFAVPFQTFRYTMQLVQGGSENLIFYYIELFAEEERIFQEIENQEEDSDVLNIIIPELRGRMACVSEKRKSGKISNVFAISPGIRMLPLKTRAQIMEKLTSGYEEVCFWGKGKQGRNTAEMLSEQIQADDIKWKYCDE